MHIAQQGDNRAGRDVVGVHANILVRHVKRRQMHHPEGTPGRKSGEIIHLSDRFACRFGLGLHP